MARTKSLTSPSGGEHRLRVEPADAAFRVYSGNDEGTSPSEAHVVPRGSDVYTVLVDGASYEALVERDDDEIFVQVGPERYRFRAGAKRAAGGRERSGGKQELKAPMPGKVVKLLVEPGQTVRAGDGVVLFEAMKMQNEIRSPADGVVTGIFVEEGAAVEAKAKLLSISPS